MVSFAVLTIRSSREGSGVKRMNKVAIVTGASGGIGGAIARRLGADGFSVVVHYSGRSEKADEAAAQIKQAGGQALAAMADISIPRT